MLKSYEIPTSSSPSGGDVKDLSIIAFGATWRSILGRHGSHGRVVGMPQGMAVLCWENAGKIMTYWCLISREWTGCWGLLG